MSTGTFTKDATTVTAEADAPPPDLDAIKAQVRSHHDRITRELAYARERRDDLNDTIRQLVADEREARRMLTAVEGRKRRGK